jgi:hypothetical protein
VGRVGRGGAQLAPKERPPIGARLEPLVLLKPVLSKLVVLEDSTDGCNQVDVDVDVDEAEAREGESDGWSAWCVRPESEKGRESVDE